MSNLDRVFASGLRDAERRLPFLRPLRADDEKVVIQIVQASTVAGALDRMFARIANAADRSALTTGLRDFWRTMAFGQQRLMVGLLLMVAAVVHVGLAVWYGSQTGWLWLIVPALAGATGLLTALFPVENDPSG